MSFLDQYWKVIVGITLAFVIAGVGLMFLSGPEKEVSIEAPAEQEVPAQKGDYYTYDRPADASPITGESCVNYDKRPFAVMYSGDLDARRYFHNLTQADFVLEMPHRPMHGQPRLMGVFGCNTPNQVGPMRSGRVDHISVAASLGAVYAPWGKSSIAGALLNRGVVDFMMIENGVRSQDGSRAGFIDRNIPITSANPAFGDVTGMIKIAGDKGYSGEAPAQVFDHQGEAPLAERPNYSKITVKFQDPYRIEYFYDKDSNTYKRFFGGKEDVDFATKEQHAPRNIVTIITKKEAWYSETDYTAQGLEDPWEGVGADYRKRDNGQYPNMQLGDPWFDTKFEGEARIFSNGQEIKGSWKKEKGADEPFQFFDEEGMPVKFAPGQIWLHVLGHAQRVSHEDEEEYNDRILDEQGSAAATQ